MIGSGRVVEERRFWSKAYEGDGRASLSIPGVGRTFVTGECYEMMYYAIYMVCRQGSVQEIPLLVVAGSFRSFFLPSFPEAYIQAGGAWFVLSTGVVGAD